VALFATGFHAIGAAQAPSPSARPAIVGYLPQVSDLAATLRFYHDILGLESAGGDPRARLTWYPTRPFLQEMYGVGGQLRNVGLRVPRSEMFIEAIQWSAAKGKRLPVRVQDPGAVQLILFVSDIDRLVNRVKQSGAKALTSGGKPVNIADETGTNRAIVVEDFSSFFVELVQRSMLPPTTPEAGPLPYIYGAALEVTVANLDQSAAFFREVLKLDVRADQSLRSDAEHQQLLGLKGSRYREAAVIWPDGTPQLRLLEIDGIARKAVEPLVADPNAALIRVNVRDMKDTFARVKAFPGASVMNLSGGPFLEGQNLYLIVRIPGSGAYLQLIGPSQGPAGALRDQ
jgi:catechol 2,3-dioxygenase-like lactoylglutathione lyase family enzyme